MALVFTAISNSLCELLLLARWHVRMGDSFTLSLDPQLFVAMACTSVGLYGFGMSLNDIIDRATGSHAGRGPPAAQRTHRRRRSACGVHRFWDDGGVRRIDRGT